MRELGRSDPHTTNRAYRYTKPTQRRFVHKAAARGGYRFLYDIPRRKEHAVNTAIGLLARESNRLPVLADLPWTIDGGNAVADLEALTDVRTRPAPPTLSMMALLHAAGWKLGDEPTPTPMWRLTATVTDGPVSLTVKGYQHTLPDGTEFRDAPAHATGSYWSPPPPEMRGRGWKARLREWNDRYPRGDWKDWTHTPLPQLPAAGNEGTWQG
jgi:hypothetical protein